MIRNLVHILMVIALANPLCCCTADQFAAADTMPMQASSCCGGESGGHENTPAQPDHDSDQCPHQANKEYQNLTSSHQDVKLAHLNVGLLPVMVLLFESYEVDSLVATASRITDSTASMAAPPELSQVYCVYRI